MRPTRPCLCVLLVAVTISEAQSYPPTIDSTPRRPIGRLPKVQADRDMVISIMRQVGIFSIAFAWKAKNLAGQIVAEKGDVFDAVSLKETLNQVSGFSPFRKRS